VRLAVVLADTGYQPAHDAWDYDRHARSIAAGDGYPESGYVPDGGPTALRAPGYSYFLGGVYALSGDSITAGRLADAALGALAVLLLYLIAKRIWGRRVALLAAGIAAVYPPLVLLSRDLLSESLFIVLELGAVLCVLAFRGTGGRLRWAAAAGILCGLAALTRNPGPVLLIPIGLGVWILRPRLGARALAAPAVVLLCAALTIAPWTLRNLVEFGRFIPVTSSTGFALAGTYNEISLHDTAHPAAWRAPNLVPQYAALFRTRGVDEGTLDATLRREATTFAWEHPGYVAEATGENLLRLAYVTDSAVIGIAGQPVEQRGIGSGSSLSERIGFAIAVALAMLGVVAIVRSRSGRDPRLRGLPRLPRGPWFLWLIPILTVAAAAPVAGLPRYRLPADPFLLILVAIGILWLWDLASARRAGSA
jgi:4-amino-4-deoxy-L-arabinose transferase-like glycosyltransferase